MPIRKHSSRKLSGGRKVRTGPRGGKYILRGGRKVYLSGGLACSHRRKNKDPKCEDQAGCEWRKGRCVKSEKPAVKKPAAPKKSAVKKPAAPKSSAAKKPAKKPPAKKKKKKSLASKEQLRKLFETKDWDAFYKALIALYRDKFNLKKEETYYIASASKEINRPMQADVIDSDDVEYAFPKFVNLTPPYRKRDAALKAAKDFVDKNGPYEDDYANLRFRQDDSPEREIASYIDFLEL